MSLFWLLSMNSDADIALQMATVSCTDRPLIQIRPFNPRLHSYGKALPTTFSKLHSGDKSLQIEGGSKT